MTVQPEPSRLAPALFWRWLLAPVLLLIAVYGPLQIWLVPATFVKAVAGSPVAAMLVGQLATLVSTAAFAVYAMVFLANVFFLQRFERLAGRRLASLWLSATLAIVAGIIAALLVRLIFTGMVGGPVAMSLVGHGMSPAAVGTMISLLGLIPSTAIGAGFGLLLWSLQQQHSPMLRDRTSQLIKAHIWGVAIAGALLGLRGVILNGTVILFGPLPALVSPVVLLAGLAIAFVPHLLLTWRAMLPALAEGPRDATGTGLFLARFLATLAPSAVPGIVLYLHMAR